MAKKDDTLEKVFKYIKNYRIFIILSLVFAAVTVILTLYLPILTGDAVDMMVSKGNVDFDGLLRIIKKMAVIIVFTGFSQWIMTR